MAPLTSALTLTHDAPIDLQLHTTYSDGIWSAEQLVDYLVAEQFALVAVTDHDRVDTVAQVQDLAARQNLPVLAAVEMSSRWNGDLTDLLCYGFDPQQNELQMLGAQVVEGQLANIQAVYAELQRQGYAFPHGQKILAHSAGEPRKLDDLWALLEEHGYAEAGKILKAAGFAWITTELAILVDAAHRSGAVCLLAHPGRGDGFTPYDPDMLDQLRLTIPIDGLEVYHPSHTPQQMDIYLDYVQTHNLLQSSGSDSHGEATRMPIKYPAELSRSLLERVGILVV